MITLQVKLLRRTIVITPSSLRSSVVIKVISNDGSLCAKRIKRDSIEIQRSILLIHWDMLDGDRRRPIHFGFRPRGIS